MKENFSISNIDDTFGKVSFSFSVFTVSHEKRNKQDTLPKMSSALSIKENTFILCFSAPQGSWFGLNLRLIGHKKASRWGRKARMGLRSALAYLSQLLFRAFCFFLFPLRYRFQFHAVIDLL
jgi:hypothetical protein